MSTNKTYTSEMSTEESEVAALEMCAAEIYKIEVLRTLGWLREDPSKRKIESLPAVLFLQIKSCFGSAVR